MTIVKKAWIKDISEEASHLWWIQGVVRVVGTQVEITDKSATTTIECSGAASAISGLTDGSLVSVLVDVKYPSTTDNGSSWHYLNFTHVGGSGCDLTRHMKLWEYEVNGEAFVE